MEFDLLGLMLFGHLAFDPAQRRLRRVGRSQYAIHWFFSYSEPLILKLVDWIITRGFLINNRAGLWLLKYAVKATWWLPHGIILTTPAAGRVIDFLSREGRVRFAMGPCVCQSAMQRFSEPVTKCIFMLYDADIILGLKRGFELISPEELKLKIEEFNRAGLIHELDMCLMNGRWTFALCNCETEICALKRIHALTGEALLAGPEINAVDGELCLGADACGICLERCPFDAIPVREGLAGLDPAKCLGCGLCVNSCPHAARSMRPRADYGFDRLVPREILLED